MALEKETKQQPRKRPQQDNVLRLIKERGVVYYDEDLDDVVKLEKAGNAEVVLEF